MKTYRFGIDDAIEQSKGALSSDVSAGSNVAISLYNADGFAIGDYVAIGYKGSETAELAQVTAVTTTSVTVGTLKLNHKQDEPIVKYRYNQIKFYGSTTREGSYSHLASYGSPATIRPDNPQGALLEYTGVEGYEWFKATYYNSTTSTETDTADAEPYLAVESERYCSIQSIRKQAGLIDNPFISDDEIEKYRKRAENEVKSYVMTRYVLPLQRDDGTLEVPALIENVTVLLAAGYMDWQQLGKDGEGVKWLGEARGILNSIKKGTQRLLDSNDDELAHTGTSNQLQGYPDDVDNSAGSTQTRRFTMTQRF